MISRRAMVAGGALAVAASGPLLRAARAAEKSLLPQGLPEGVYDTAMLEALPGKKPLIKLTYRPPNYETPLAYFKTRIHAQRCLLRALSPRRNPGVRSTPRQWRLKIGGDGGGEPARADA